MVKKHRYKGKSKNNSSSLDPRPERPLQPKSTPRIIFVGTKNKVKLLSVRDGLIPYHPKDKFEIFVVSTTVVAQEDNKQNDDKNAGKSGKKQTIVIEKRDESVAFPQMSFPKSPTPRTIHYIIGIDVESGVSPQPLSAKETLIGSQNRCQNLQKVINQTPKNTLLSLFPHKTLPSDDFYYVGIEGGLEKVIFGEENGKEKGLWFDSGYVCVENSKQIRSIATSSRAPVPDFIAEQLTSTYDITKVTGTITGTKTHYMDLITNNALPRGKSYNDGVTFAFSRFYSHEMMWVGKEKEGK